MDIHADVDAHFSEFPEGKQHSAVEVHVALAA